MRKLRIKDAMWLTKIDKINKLWNLSLGAFDSKTCEMNDKTVLP